MLKRLLGYKGHREHYRLSLCLFSCAHWGSHIYSLLGTRQASRRLINAKLLAAPAGCLPQGPVLAAQMPS